MVCGRPPINDQMFNHDHQKTFNFSTLRQNYTLGTGISLRSMSFARQVPVPYITLFNFSFAGIKHYASNSQHLNN